LGEQSLTSANVPDINMGNRRNTKVNIASDGTRLVTLLDPVDGYDTLVADAAFTYTLASAPLYTGPFPVRVFGEYLHNGAPASQNRGWQAGIAFGKAGKKKTWELSYRYKHLEGDAWWEELADSDFGAFYQDNPPTTGQPVRHRSSGYWAGTNARGHVVRASYSPLDSLTLTVTWFATDLIREYAPGSNSSMNRLQVDGVLKF
jgi:hypothetical protein